MIRRKRIFLVAQLLLVGLCTAGSVLAQTPTPSQTPSPTMTPTPSASPSPTASPTGSPTAAPSATPSAAPTATTLTAVDTAFFNAAARADNFEIAAGQLAQTNASRKDLRSFGQRMVNDHSQSLTTLAAIGQNKGLVAPTDISDADQVALAGLTGKTGRAFDEDYVQEMFVGHQADIDLYRSYTEVGSDPDLVAFAQQQLRVLRTHLTRVRTIVIKIGGQAGLVAAQHGRPIRATGRGRGGAAGANTGDRQTGQGGQGQGAQTQGQAAEPVPSATQDRWLYDDGISAPNLR